MTWTQLRPTHAALPPDGQDVLVYCPGHEHGDYQAASCQTDIGGTEWLSGTGEWLFGVEAWMPIPPGADVK